MKKHGNLKYDNILNKYFLYKEYIQNSKNLKEISNNVNCSIETVRKYLLKFKIPIRNKYKFGNNENNLNYIDGRSRTKTYCINCGKIINYRNKRCQSCAVKYLYKIGKLNSKKEHNGNWKGGISSLCKKIKESEIYINWRKQVFQRDNYTCQECGKKGTLNVHHIKKFSKILKEFLEFHNNLNPIKDKYELLELSKEWQEFWQIDNGQTLCEKCHSKIHHNMNYLRKK